MSNHQICTCREDDWRGRILCETHGMNAIQDKLEATERHCRELRQRAEAAEQALVITARERDEWKELYTDAAKKLWPIHARPGNSTAAPDQ